MPGFNLTGAPNTQDYVLGRGRVLLAKLDGATGLPDDDGFRDLGNCPQFNLTVTVEDLRHQNSRDCIKFTDKRFVISQDLGISFQLDELNFDNLNEFLSGTTQTYDNPHDVLHTDVTIEEDIKKGRWYELRKANGSRVYNLNATGVVFTIEKGPAPGTALVEGTDFEIDRQLGLIRPLPASVTLVNGDEIIWTISTGATTPKDLDQVNALERASVEGALLFIQDNAGDCGQRTEYRFHLVSISADGDLSLIGDEVSVMSFSGVAEVNSFITDPSQVLTVRTYDMV